jgi:hypothetical protein
MWKLDKPVRHAGSTYRTCISRVKNAQLKARLQAIEQYVIEASGAFNKAKIDAVPHNSAEETLHPYFDDVENDLWLKASVVKAEPAALRFCVEPHEDWDDVMTARVLRHFKVLGLAALYASQAAEELLSIRHELAGLLVEAGAVAVSKHLTLMGQLGVVLSGRIGGLGCYGNRSERVGRSPVG